MEDILNILHDCVNDIATDYKMTTTAINTAKLYVHSCDSLFTFEDTHHFTVILYLCIPFVICSLVLWFQRCAAYLELPWGHNYRAVFTSTGERDNNRLLYDIS